MEPHALDNRLGCDRSRRRAMLRLVWAAGCMAAVLGAGCGDASGSARAPGPLRVVVTVPPLSGLVRAVAPADARVTMLMAPGRSEHGYEFTPADLAALGDADLVVTVGLNLEPPVDRFLAEHPSPCRVELCFAKVVNPRMPDASWDPRMIGPPGERHLYGSGAGGAEHGGDEHAGVPTDDGDGHGHGPIDPHLWLDPGLAIALVPEMVRAVREAGSRAGVDVGDAAGRGEAVLARLRGLDEKYRAALAPFAGAAIVTHHAAWGRLAWRYGLRVAAVVREIETGDPTPGQIAASVEAIRAEHVKTVFVEPQFNPDAARRIAAAAGVRVGTLDPLGDGDYFGMMETNLAALVKGLAE